MPKKVREMSAVEVRNITKEGLHAVGGVAGLCLSVSGTGSRSWILRAMVGHKRREIGLGGYPDVTLAQARDAARQKRQRIRDGSDPVEERRSANAEIKAQQKRGITLTYAYDIYLRTKKFAELSNEKHRRQWQSTFDTYVKPIIGDFMVHELTVQDIRRVLDPIWASKTETASRIRGRLEEVLTWATASGHRDGENPARWQGNLKEMLAAPAKLKKEVAQPALSLVDAPRWFATLTRMEGAGSRALEFLALTAGRSGEVRGATWDEFDLDAAVWVVPGARMKAGREHRVPLTPRMIALIKAMPRMQGSDFVFAAARGGQLSDMTLSAAMRRMHEGEVKAGRKGYLDQRSGRPAVPHGLRSTFRDWAAEMTNYPRDMAEMALAHFIGTDVERAYRRGDQVQKRREMMVAWEGFLCGYCSEVWKVNSDRS